MSGQGAPVVIDFDKLGGPVYVGRDRGIREREKYKLDELDDLDVTIAVRIPQSTYSINSSFFLGLFGASIVKAGSSKKFREKYRISAPAAINNSIESYIERALQEKSFILKIDKA